MNYIRFLGGATRFRRSHTTYKLQCCSIGTHPLKFIEMETKWKNQDRMPKNWELIYKGPMDRAFNLLSTYVSITSSLFVCAGVYYSVFAYNNLDSNEPVYLGSSDVIMADNLNECLIYIGAFIIFHVAVKILVSKYVLRIYKNGDNYTAIYRGHFYNRIHKHDFHLDTFKKLNPAIMVGWGDSRFSLNGKHSIILEPYFKAPEYFNYLLYKTKLDYD